MPEVVTSVAAGFGTQESQDYQPWNTDEGTANNYLIMFFSPYPLVEQAGFLVSVMRNDPQDLIPNRNAYTSCPFYFCFLKVACGENSHNIPQHCCTEWLWLLLHWTKE